MPILELMHQEHRRIEAVLDAMVVFGRRVGVGSGDPAADRAWLADCVGFLRGYADELHHGKEEAILFAVLLRRGAPAGLGAPLAAIRRDHETARLLIADLAAAARQGAWSADARKRLERTVCDYASLLRRHIGDEDRHIFPAVEAALGGTGMQQVDCLGAAFEQAHAARRAELEALAASLLAAPPA
jgi:hemerythrin-like domain-containing protein